MNEIKGECGETVALIGNVLVIEDLAAGRGAGALLSPAARRALAAALLEGLPANEAYPGGVLSQEDADACIAALKAGKTLTFKLTTEPRS